MKEMMKCADVLTQTAEHEEGTILRPLGTSRTFSKRILLERVVAGVRVGAIEFVFVGYRRLARISENKLARVKQVLARLTLGGDDLALVVLLIALVGILPQREYVSFVL